MKTTEIIETSIEGPTHIQGPKMTWNTDGLHIEDPKLANQPQRVGGLPGSWWIDWETIERMRADFLPLKFLACAEGSPAATFKPDHATRRMGKRDSADVEADEKADTELAARMVIERGKYFPQSSGVLIACSFEFDGQLHGLSVPIPPPGGFQVPDSEIPILNITAKDANTLGIMLRDLAWSHAESQRLLREKAAAAATTKEPHEYPTAPG